MSLKPEKNKDIHIPKINYDSTEFRLKIIELKIKYIEDSIEKIINILESMISLLEKT